MAGASQGSPDHRNAKPSRRALVIEPSAALGRLLPDMFRQLGFEVDLVAGPEEAFAAVESGPAFDLLVTELVLPEISGRKVASFITTRHPNTAVLYLCDELARSIIERPRIAALEKPFSLEQLSEKIRILFAPATA